MGCVLSHAPSGSFSLKMGEARRVAIVPASEVECLAAWSQLRHRIIALQLEADLPKQIDDSTQALTYITVFLGGLGPPDCKNLPAVPVVLRKRREKHNRKGSCLSCKN